MRHALNTTPLNGVATLLGSGASSLTLLAQGDLRRAVQGSGASALDLQASGAAKLIVRPTGSVSMALSAAGNIKLAKTGSGSSALSMVLAGAAMLILRPRGSVAMSLAATGTGTTVGPVYGSGAVSMALSAYGTGQRHTPRFGAGEVTMTLHAMARARLEQHATAMPVTMQLALSGYGRVGNVLRGDGGSVSMALTLRGDGRVVPTVRGEGAVRLSLVLRHVHAWPPLPTGFTASPRSFVLPAENRLFIATTTTEGSMLGTVPKTAADQLDYDVDCARWLAGDTIAGVSAAIERPDEVLLVRNAEHSASRVKVWLAGGTPGKTYTITVTISTTAGRLKNESFAVRVRA